MNANRTGCDRSSSARRVRRVTVVGLLALVAALLCGSSAQASVTIPGGLGGEILGIPVPGPVAPVPNVFPVPPPPPREPGFAPAPAPPSRLTFPVPEPSTGVNDGPGSGPPHAAPGRVDADTPPSDGGKPGGTDPRAPVGKLSRVDDKFLKRKGVNAHYEKKRAGLMPQSRFDIYVDQEGTMFGVAKGQDPKYGEYIGELPH